MMIPTVAAQTLGWGSFQVSLMIRSTLHKEYSSLSTEVALFWLFNFLPLFLHFFLHPVLIFVMSPSLRAALIGCFKRNTVNDMQTVYAATYHGTHHMAPEVNIEIIQKIWEKGK